MRQYAGKTIRTIAVSAIACALLLAACQNPMRSSPAFSPGAGAVFLTFNGTAARTILPSWPGLSAFYRFVLEFTDVSGGGFDNFEVENWDGAAPVDIPSGTWIVEASAFLPGVNGAPARQTARGSSASFTVTAGQAVTVNIVLRPLPMSDGGYGTFVWNIGFAGITGLYFAEMITTDLDGSLVHDEELDIFPGTESWEGSHSLQAGWYLVHLTLFKQQGGGEYEATVSAVLHVYQNLESVFTETFMAAHFPTVLTGTVSISGSAVVGQTLTADTTALDGSGALGFQWMRDGVEIGGATNSTFLLTAADYDAAITVTVTRAGFTGSVTSAPTAAVILPTLTGTVTITGSAVVGGTLTADITALEGYGTPRFYWFRYLDALSLIWAGSYPHNSATYTLQPEDIGRTILVRVYRDGYDSGIDSDRTAEVTWPVLTGTVSIDGSAWRGQTLTANTTALDGTGALGFQWMRNGVDEIPGATNNTFLLTADDYYATITVTVTRDGYTGSVTSAATAAVTQPPLTGTVRIGGARVVGGIMSADLSNLPGAGAPSFQWIRDDVPILGATESTFELTEDEVGYYLYLRVTRYGYTGYVTGQAMDPVTWPALAGTVTITGSAVVGETLAANTDNIWGIADGNRTFIFQWRRHNGTDTDIVGTNSPYYEVQAADVGSTITVTVTHGTSIGYVTSDPTSVVVP